MSNKKSSRIIETVFEETTEAVDWFDATEPHEVVETIEPETVAHNPTTHTLAEGENILTVAKLYLPAGWTRNEYAKHLVNINGLLAVGKVISLV